MNSKILPKKDADSLEELVQLISSTKTKEEIRLLLEAILTPEELHQIKGRWQIVKMLIAGNTVRETAGNLQISVAKVSRGSQELKFGSGIFQKLFKRIYPKKK